MLWLINVSACQPTCLYQPKYYSTELTLVTLTNWPTVFTPKRWFITFLHINYTNGSRTHNKFGDRSFAVAGPRLWNSLPTSLRQITSYGQFRRYLKTNLFGNWKITAQHDLWFSVLYKYLLTYLLFTAELSLVYALILGCIEIEDAFLFNHALTLTFCGDFFY